MAAKTLEALLASHDQVWLEEALDPEEAAEFLPSTRSWLERMRMEPGKGPEFFRVGRNVFYTRRALISFRWHHQHKSTTEYTRQAGVASSSPAPVGDDDGSTP